MKTASIEKIRSAFPALERKHNGLAVAYFDGPGGTQVPRPVAEAMTDYLYHHNANSHWAYPSSAETDEIIANARQTFADFLNATAEEIVFGANMTTLTFHLSRALGRQFSTGDEIVVTELDHHANVDPWREMAKDFDLEVKTARMIPETGQLDWQHFESCVTPKTKLVAVGAASNALGTISDVQRASRLARSVGATVMVDAVHYAPHGLIDVQEFDCDFLVCSAYKFYGPHIGILFGKQDLLNGLEFPRLLPAANKAPELAETGTLNHEGIAGAAAAVDFLANLAPGATRRACLQAAMVELHGRGKTLVQQMSSGLAALPGVRLFGPEPSAARTPTICFAVADMPSKKVTEHLAEKAVFTSHGDYYATTAVERLGYAQDGLVRSGCACYTTKDEVDRLIDGVTQILGVRQ